MIPAASAQVDALRTVMATDFGVTDTPTWEPAEPYAARPQYHLAARSSLTRRQMLDQLPVEQRERRLLDLEAFGEAGVDLDSPEVVEVVVHGYVDRRGEKPISPDGPMDPARFDRWLVEQCRMHVPAGYVPVGRWDRVSPIEAARAAQAAQASAPRVLYAAVRNALERGVPATRLAEALDVSRARVYQLRDGTR